MSSNKTLRVVRRRRAAMLLWYILIAFPMLVLCGVISLEYQRILTGARVAQTLADASAKFSTQQYLPPPGEDGAPTAGEYQAQGCFDEYQQTMCLIKGDVAVAGKQSISQAVTSFVKVYTDAVSANEGARYLTVTDVRVVEIRQSVWTGAGAITTPAQVTVEIMYKVPSVGFLGLGRLLGADTSEGTYVARSFAQICVPGAGETVTKECEATEAS